MFQEPTKEKDAGQFVCTAKNESGKLTATFTVKFEGFFFLDFKFQYEFEIDALTRCFRLNVYSLLSYFSATRSSDLYS